MEEDVEYGLARVASARVASIGLQLRVFRDEEAARTWLASAGEEELGTA